MKNNRRDFIKKTASIASALSVGGLGSAIASAPAIHTKGNTGENLFTAAKDAGMQMSEAYFAGMDERRIAFMKQLDVLGAVSGINPKLATISDAAAWDPKVITPNKKTLE